MYSNRIHYSIRKTVNADPKVKKMPRGEPDDVVELRLQTTIA